MSCYLMFNKLHNYTYVTWYLAITAVGADLYMLHGCHDAPRQVVLVTPTHKLYLNGKYNDYMHHYMLFILGVSSTCEHRHVTGIGLRWTYKKGPPNLNPYSRQIQWQEITICTTKKIVVIYV